MKTLLARTSASLACFTCVILLHGQGPEPTPARVALRIDGLTSAERDQLTSDLGQQGELRISFACVPAGILILEPVGTDRSVDSVRAMAASALIRRLPTERRSEIALSLNEAEQLCSEARNQ